MPEIAKNAIAGLVLAGGLSRRMGGDKGLKPLAGQPMIAHVLGRIGPQVGPLAVNANAPGYEGFGLPVLADPVAGFPGPLAGILAGLHWAAGLGASHLLSVPGDAPFLPRDLVARLAAAAEEGRPAIARSAAGLQPVVGLWPVGLADALADWIESGSPKVRDWAAAAGAAICDFPAAVRGPEPFFNVNTPEERAEAERWAAEG